MTESTPETEVTQLCAELDAYIERRSALFKRSLIFYYSTFGLCLLLGPALRLFITSMQRTPFNRTMVICFAGLFVCMLTVSLLALPLHIFTSWNRDIRRKAASLAELRDVSSSATLLGLLGIPDDKLRKIAEQALLEIVPFWTENEWAALNAEERRRIRYVINPTSIARQKTWIPELTYPACKELRIAFCRATARFGN